LNIKKIVDILAESKLKKLEKEKATSKKSKSQLRPPNVTSGLAELEQECRIIRKLVAKLLTRYYCCTTTSVRGTNGL